MQRDDDDDFLAELDAALEDALIEKEFDDLLNAMLEEPERDFDDTYWEEFDLDHDIGDETDPYSET